LEGDKGTVDETEKVLARRTIQGQEGETSQVLVQWKGKAADEATWEDSILMRSQFPKFDLEDKVLISGVSIVRTATGQKELKESLINHEVVGPKVWQ
ncbi:RNA-directed DNA polymerase (Reverse transcriptase), partial [Trifolium medium]|nr:RNA-directed DNA polymerase (Reverse transcriptase) [Trifolium medium]